MKAWPRFAAPMTSALPASDSDRAAHAVGGDDPLPPGHPRRLWCVGFALIFLLLATWSLATPKYAAPDEPVHAIRAASLVRGELLGQDVSRAGDPSVRVSVPATLAAYDPHCFIFRPWVTASCMPNWVGHPGLVRVNTYTGRYPPLYYLAAGLPSLLTTGGAMLLWMRLAQDLVNAVFLTAAFVLLARARRSSWALVGGFAAMTPLVLFLGSVINPSGLEICSAIACWSALLAAVGSGPGVLARSTVVWAAVSALVFESTRGLSPVYLLATVAAVGLVTGRSRVRELTRRRDVRTAAGFVAAGGALSVGWVVIAGALRLSRTTPITPSVSTLHILHLSLLSNSRFAQFVGEFGWLDTPSPWWVVGLWWAAAAVLLAGMIANRAWRGLLIVAVLVFATVLIPTLGDLVQARTIGLVSQARYILPLSVGVPLIAGMSIGHRDRWARFVPHLLMAFLALGQLGAFVRTLRRYETGLGGALSPSAPWSPPLGSVALTAIFVVAGVGLQIWLWQLVRARRTPTPIPAVIGHG